MKQEEFNLSEKMYEKWNGVDMFELKDVKEFIRRLKKMFRSNSLKYGGEIKFEIDKLAGDKLV